MSGRSFSVPFTGENLDFFLILFEKYLKGIEIIRHSLSSLIWCFLTVFFGLLQVWIVLFILYIHNEAIPASKLFMGGALLFFSTAVVSSLAIDYYFSKKYSLKNRGSEHFAFVFFPLLIILSSLILFFACYPPNSPIPKTGFNRPFANSMELAIITCAFIYAFVLKYVTFKSECGKDN